jgi:adenosyl cobinamide kinase/adenosyl cobinamide phosphate guanylyltransferase
VLLLLLGGARSGKSQLALRLARAQPAPVVFLATAQAVDDEMRERIDRHRRERPAGWRTIEEPLRLVETIPGVAADSCLVIDCLTLWTANLLAESGAIEVAKQAAAVAHAAARRTGRTVVVSNEVGLGIVPATPLGREYRDLLGHVNAVFAAAADRAYLLVAGRTLRLQEVDSLLSELA